MKLLEFDNEELNAINVCLDHYIEEQTDEGFEFKISKQDVGNYHKGIGWDDLEEHSTYLHRLSIAIRTIKKIHEQEKQIKESGK